MFNERCQNCHLQSWLWCSSQAYFENIWSLALVNCMPIKSDSIDFVLFLSEDGLDSGNTKHWQMSQKLTLLSFGNLTSKITRYNNQTVVTKGVFACHSQFWWIRCKTGLAISSAETGLLHVRSDFLMWFLFITWSFFGDTFRCWWLWITSLQDSQLPSLYFTLSYKPQQRRRLSCKENVSWQHSHWHFWWMGWSIVYFS